jgi:hypothetical protein
MRRLYAVVVSLFPRQLRNNYGADMKLLFADMLDDPDVSRWRIWRGILGDLANLTGGLRLGAVFGFLVVLMWLANRSIDVGARDPGSAGPLGLIALLFVAVGFIGSRRSGTFAGGIMTGFTAGLISALTVPGDYLLFGIFPFYDMMSFVFTMAISAAVVMLLATAGALLSGIPSHRHRLGRSVGAFFAAWRQIPS